ncbi:hypothetical protein HOR73_gp032 [Escherichia phage phiLLS]|uniref:Uncharacterized protein n=1 Tax=Escherichia phage phiLLS TaxID=1965465 RepID=A0A1V0DZH2_9CAUD|nr:hypothetical protein HOR73_gp032 [Escherichia phage phiLLS]ARB06859.1 hypothetical protein lls_32 [Escherichia phage phiLLS]
MDFLNQNPKSNPENMLIEQWNYGYNAGIATCIARLDMLIKQEKVRPEEAILLRDIIEGFKRGIV